MCCLDLPLASSTVYLLDFVFFGEYQLLTFLPSTCYGLIVGEVCPNKYKFTGVAAVVIPNVVATGFGAYIAIALTRELSWRSVIYAIVTSTD